MMMSPAADVITTSPTCMFVAAQQLLLPPEDAPCLSPSIRRRSFCTTTGGVVNSGDVIIDDVDVVNTILTRSREGSTETDVSDMSCGSAGAGAMMRVLVIGAAGVGKTALAQQFMTSEHIAAQNNSFGQWLQCLYGVC